MILDSVINKFLRDTIDLILQTPGFAIAAKQQDAPRPSGAYADVDFTSEAGIGWEQFQYVDQPVGTLIDLTISGMRNIMFSVNFYRLNAYDNARRVHLAFAKESIVDLFNRANLSLTRRSEVRELAIALENTWEDRAQLDIFLSAVGTDTDIIQSIGSVDIFAEFQSRGLIYDFTIEVSE